ncbi:MAG: TIGR03084 family protein [Chloroflexi bacterium]|nr:TIGR03084 family protein [Chloroflexota bacterium]
MREIVTDLKAEHEVLDQLLVMLKEEDWGLLTPAEGWTIRDSVSHVAYFDEVSTSLIRGDTSIEEEKARLGSGADRMDTQRGENMKPPEVLLWWRKVRAIMLEELIQCDPKQRIPWFAMPMGARSFATARLMETWAHGLDCFAAVGAEPVDTDRLQHVALLAYLARPWAYQVNGLAMPQTHLRLELQLPSGTLCSHGPENARDVIRGHASDFCRVAVRRRHWRDTDLVIEGDEAKRFVQIAQAYAGSPGSGRKPKRPLA